MAHRIQVPQATRFLAVIPYTFHLFSSVLAYLDNSPNGHGCSPTTYAMVTPSPNAQPYPITKQGQAVTTYVPKYAVCNPDYTDCTTAYDTSTYAWCSTRIPCYGKDCTVTDCNQMVTFSHTQSYHLNSAVCPTAGNCNIYGTNVYLPSPTTKTYAEPVYTYYAAPYLDYMEHDYSAVTVEECVYVHPQHPVCSEHVEKWEEQYAVHTSVEILPVTIHTYCANPTQILQGTSVIHVTAPTTLMYLTEVKHTSLSTETWTAKASRAGKCTAPHERIMPTITPSEHVTRKHLVVDPVVAATSLGMGYGDEGLAKIDKHTPTPMPMMKALPAMGGLGDTLHGHDYPSEPEHKVYDINPTPTVEAPCVTSTTYIWQEPPPHTLAVPIIPTTTTTTTTPTTTHSKGPTPASPTPVVVPAGPAPCEGAYCAAPEQKPNPSPHPAPPECKGYDCPIVQAEQHTTPTCSGVDCPEHDYDQGYHEPEPIVPLAEPEPIADGCGGYSCVDDEVDAVDLYDGEDDHDDDHGFDLEEDFKEDFKKDLKEELNDDEDFHSHMLDVDLDMETGEVQVNVNVSKVFA